MENNCRYYHMLHIFKRTKKSKSKNAVDIVSDQYFCRIHSIGDSHVACDFLDRQKYCPDFEEENK